MAFFNYLHSNIKWQFRQNSFDKLNCHRTGKEALLHQLHNLGDKYYPDKRKVDVLTTEFCLNKIALSHAETVGQKLLQQRFTEQWTKFCLLKRLFARQYMYFPADGNGTRVEQIAELIARCSGFCLSDNELAEILREACVATDLTPREKQYLPEVLDLYKINTYCALYAAKRDVETAKVLQPTLLNYDYQPNTRYRQSVYRCGKLSAMLNCLGNSALSYGQTDLDYRQNVYVYANGRNVFDTFTACKFGQNTAEFCAESKSTKVTMQYFLADFCQTKRFTLTNNGKAKRRFVVDIVVRDKGEKLFVGDCHTVCDNDVYIATCPIVDNDKIACTAENDTLSFTFDVQSQQTVRFDIVTVVSHNAEILAREIASLSEFGRTRCPYIEDKPSVEVTSESAIDNLTSYSNQARLPSETPSTKADYTYRLGNADVGSFVDNDGNATTLLNGFVFGKGELVYAVSGGKLTRLNCGNFCVDGQTLRYETSESCCTVTHDNCKHIAVNYAKPTRTLFYFPLEQCGNVTKTTNGFTFCGTTRRFELHCVGQIESYTTDALECNPTRLRYKLSDNIKRGTCLAICFKPTTAVEVTLVNANHTPQPSPLLRESLLSTYLNYVNGKNVFGYTNHLVKPDPLTLAAICYTNPRFVREYLQAANNPDFCPAYYAADGSLQHCNDRLLTAFATVYYANLVADGDYPDNTTIEDCQKVLLSDGFSDKQLCVKALALKKAAALKGFDKVRCMIEYANVKRLISGDSTLYPYAQAIGALPMTNPSKQRLRDLCRKYNIPQAWYYVSQVENLYGMNYSLGKLSFCPSVAADNILEQLAVTVDGKHINTTFARSSVQSMTLNGVTHFQPFCPSALPNTDNTLVVTY